MFKALLVRELIGAWRNMHAVFQPLLFFVLTICLFPIAIGADNNSLALLAPAALWIALLFATLLASEQFFQADFQDGTLSQDVIHFGSLWLVLVAKLIATWLRFALPLILCLPLVALLLHIPWTSFWLVVLLLILGSFCLLLIAMLGAALTLTQTQSTFLLFLIVIPLFVPLLIIGVSATSDCLIGLPISGHLALLSAFALFSLITIIPFATLAIKSHPLP